MSRNIKNSDFEHTSLVCLELHCPSYCDLLLLPFSFQVNFHGFLEEDSLFKDPSSLNGFIKFPLAKLKGSFPCIAASTPKWVSFFMEREYSTATCLHVAVDSGLCFVVLERLPLLEEAATIWNRYEGEGLHISFIFVSDQTIYAHVQSMPYVQFLFTFIWYPILSSLLASFALQSLGTILSLNARAKQAKLQSISATTVLLPVELLVGFLIKDIWGIFTLNNIMAFVRVEPLSYPRWEMHTFCRLVFNCHIKLSSYLSKIYDGFEFGLDILNMSAPRLSIMFLEICMEWRGEGFKLFLKQAQSFLSINLLPSMERDMVLYNTRAQKEAQAHFDTTSLVDLSEKICLNVPSAQGSFSPKKELRHNASGYFIGKIPQDHRFWHALDLLNNIISFKLVGGFPAQFSDLFEISFSICHLMANFDLPLSNICSQTILGHADWLQRLA
eukprot:Gb_23657 [translate_table: standard]